MNNNTPSFPDFVTQSRAMLDELIEELSTVYNNTELTLKEKKAKFGLIAMNRGLAADDFSAMLVA